MIGVDIYSRWKTWQRDVPEGWDELTQGQYLAVSSLLYGEPMEKLAMQVKLVKILCGLTRWQMLMVGEENILQLVPLTEWVFEKAEITKQLIPFFEIDKVKYHGPKDRIINLRNCEFDAAERSLYYWQLRLKELTDAGGKEDDVWKDEEGLLHIWEFVAALYREGKKGYDSARDPDGDIRVSYNQNLLPYTGIVFRSYLPLGYAKAILLWYKGCREYMYSVEAYRAIFDEHNAGADQGENAYFGMMRAIAEKGIYGTFDDVEQMYLWTTMEELKHCKEEVDRMKNKYPKADVDI